MSDFEKSSRAGIEATRETLRRREWLTRPGRTRVDLTDRDGILVPLSCLCKRPAPTMSISSRPTGTHAPKRSPPLACGHMRQRVF